MNSDSEQNIVAQIKYILASSPFFRSEWEAYKKEVLYHSSPEELEVLQRIFYCGGLVATSIIADSPEKEITLTSLRLELSTFFEKASQDFEGSAISDIKNTEVFDPTSRN